LHEKRFVLLTLFCLQMLWSRLPSPMNYLKAFCLLCNCCISFGCYPECSLLKAISSMWAKRANSLRLLAVINYLNCFWSSLGTCCFVLHFAAKHLDQGIVRFVLECQAITTDSKRCLIHLIMLVAWD
jgi:hypothetical protein